MTPSVYLDRLGRVRAAMAEQGVDVLLLSLGHDLPYLTGYDAMPLERLTMLVVPRDADATLLVPRLEAPRVCRAAGRVHAAHLGRDRGSDRPRRRARRAGGDRRRRRPDVGPLPRRAAPASAGRLVPPRRRRRRPAADGEGRRRDRCAARGQRGRRPGRPPAPGRRDRARRTHRGRGVRRHLRPAARRGPRQGQLRHRRRRPQRRQPAPRRRRPGDRRPARSCSATSAAR